MHREVSRAGRAGRRAVVTCAVGEGGPLASQPPTGTYYATDKGLWWFGPAQPFDAAQGLSPKRMLIANPPVVNETHLTTPDGLEEMFHAKPQPDGAWCFGYSAALGDEGGWELCMSAVKGILKGSTFEAGATSVDITYRRQ